MICCDKRGYQMVNCGDSIAELRNFELVSPQTKPQMKLWNFAWIGLFAGLTTAASAQCDLFFSEAAEGSSNNKYLEIYNPTSAEVDLSGYAFPSVSNAPTVVGQYEFWNAFPEGAVVAPGDVYVIAHPSADPTILAASDHTFTFLSNGDDGFALVQGTEADFVILDVIGNWEGDPGSGWEVAGVSNGTKDHTIVRKPDVTQGVGYDWATAAGTNADDSQWVVLEMDDWSNLGTHDFTGNCGPAVLGCTNENATNYNDAATEDDGSCLFDNACNADAVVVEAGAFYYAPSALSIEPGTTVAFVNAGGTHDVNGDINSQTGESFGNPVDFYLDVVSAGGTPVCIGTFTFDVPGVYNYDCSVSNHAALGMVATITVGTGGCTNPAAPNYNEAADFDDGSCLEVVLTPISDIQQAQLTDGLIDQTVTTTGIVTGVFGSLVSFQDGTGAYSGIWMFGPDVPVSLGDEIEVTGTVSEYFGLTQLTGVGVTILSQGNDLPAAEVLATSAIADEQWEGVLVQTTGDVTAEANNFGEWALSDGSGDANVDDRGYDAETTGALLLGSTWQVTGPMDYSFSAFKIQPRDAGDALLYGCTNSSAANYEAAAGIDDGSCIFDGADCGLFISEAAEGSSNNKYLELYNPTGSTIFLASYIFGNCSNGCDNPDAEVVSDVVDYWTFTFPFDASIAPGATYVVAHPQADPTILDVADMTYQYLSNGDDAYILADISSGDTVVVDVVGDLGLDPGTGWDVAGVSSATANHTLVRQPFVLAGNAGDWATSAGTNEFDSEWIVLESNDWTNLGTHAFNGGCASTGGGCTDEFAINYDPAATSDDGSCLYIPNLTIAEIQSTAFSGAAITSGVVTAVYAPNGAVGGDPSFVIQDGTGQHSAIWVIGDGVAVGDEVELQGNVTVIYGLRQIQGAAITINSSGNTLPNPQLLSTGDINQDGWECVLVRVLGECTSITPQYGEWVVSDGGDGGMVASLGYNAIEDSSDVSGMMMSFVELGKNYQVTGPNFYSFGNWKLCPRTATDVTRLGCTDPTFANYDVMATQDDGSCINLEGCTDATADNYDPAATIDDGTCSISGCDDAAAFNYNPAVNNPTNEVCYYSLPSLVINEIHYNPCSAQGDDFDYEFMEIYNAGDQSWNLEGTVILTEASGAMQVGLVFGAGTSIAAGEYILIVASDEAAANYAYTGAQTFVLELGNFSNSGEQVAIEDAWGNAIDSVDYDDASPWPSQTIGVLGNNVVQNPDGDCSSLELVATDLDNANPQNWQPSWVDNGTPGAQNSTLFGCTDAAACNYNGMALFDDGTCHTDCYGCTYDGASNYVDAATIDDGTCVFEFANDCPADLNGDNQVTAADLLSFLSQFGTACPE